MPVRSGYTRFEVEALDANRGTCSGPRGRSGFQAEAIRGGGLAGVSGQTPSRLRLARRRAAGTAAWVAYYRREWWAFLRSAIALTHRTFGLSWLSTLWGAWLVLRANQLWAPSPDNDPDGVRAARWSASTRSLTAGTANASILRWRRGSRSNGGGCIANTSTLLMAIPTSARWSTRWSRCTRTCTACPRILCAALPRSVRWRWITQIGGCKRGALWGARSSQERAALVRSYAGLLAAVHRV